MTGAHVSRSGFSSVMESTYELPFHEPLTWHVCAFAPTLVALQSCIVTGFSNLQCVLNAQPTGYAVEEIADPAAGYPPSGGFYVQP
jgi:hypothetical protein